MSAHPAGAGVRGGWAGASGVAGCAKRAALSARPASCSEAHVPYRLREYSLNRYVREQICKEGILALDLPAVSQQIHW